MIADFLFASLATFGLLGGAIFLWSRAWHVGYAVGRVEGGRIGFLQGRASERDEALGEDRQPAMVLLTTGDGSFERPIEKTLHDARCAAFLPGGQCDCGFGAFPVQLNGEQKPAPSLLPPIHRR